MNKPIMMLLMGLLYCASVNAAEQAACQDIRLPHQDLSASELRAIAASCHDQAVARLYYNRAYHQDLLAEGEALSSIIPHNYDSGKHHVTAYRIYIALVEELAPQWFANTAAHVKFLNQIYEQRGEIVELRIHGYDRTADVLERKLLF